MAKAESVGPEQWLDVYGDDLYRFAFSRLRDSDAAEEVVQDTFVSALKNVKQFSGAGSERGWLLGILKNKIIDVFRKRQRDPIHVDENTGDISGMLFTEKGFWRKEMKAVIKQSLDSLETKEFWAILKKCLSALPPRQADVFTLRTMDDQSAESICKELEISATNYWVILHRARLQLSGCLKERWFQESSN